MDGPVTDEQPQPLSPATDSETDALLADLTEPQRQAASFVDGPLLVLAGAGSGKTRVITRRIAHLVLRVGIAPWNILAITFTNKAAGEMKERVAKVLSERQAQAVTVCTFHALCARVLRQYADRLKLPPGYSIYDTSDQQRAIKTALQELQINADNFPPGKVLGTISSAKNELIDEQAFADKAYDFYSKNVAKIYRKYQQILTRSNALDFDDLMLKTVQLLRHHPDALAQLQQRFQYILIDEYQDTNHAQFVIASALAASHKNICATGDPDQSIYGWRGANIRNILDFETHYPAATVVRLEQNYRSTQRILALADALIKNNTQRKHKSLWTENELGEKASLVTTRDERHEAQWIVDQLRELRTKHEIPWGRMAIFYRMNSLSRVIEDALRTSSVPYQIARGTAFYERKEIKDALGYLRVIANPTDEVNLLRIINTPPRGISAATVSALQAHAVAHQTTVVALLGAPAQVQSLNTRAAASVLKFSQLLDKWRIEAGLDPDAGELQEDHSRGTLKDFVERVLRESGLEQMHREDKADPDQERLANLGELVSSVVQFERDRTASAEAEPALGQLLTEYLEQVSLVSDVDAINGDQGAVTLMTLHAAKGLEFPVVAILGLEDGLLPHQRANTSNHELEEERRLLFVGITRAQRFLLLSHARYRTVFGQTMPTIPSRFLAELPREHVQGDDLGDEDPFLSPGRASQESISQRSFASEQSAAFPVGTMVRHALFGVGRVVSVSSGGASAKAQVMFKTAGLKNLVLQYAKLEKVSS